MGAGMVDPNERPAENGPSQSENSAESATAPGTGTDIDSDMATVISSIMNHAERVEEQCAMGEQQLGEDMSNQEAPKGVVFVKANSHLKIQSLPILDNLVRPCNLKSIPITECLRDSVSVHTNHIYLPKKSTGILLVPPSPPCHHTIAIFTTPNWPLTHHGRPTTISRAAAGVILAAAIANNRIARPATNTRTGTA